MSHPDPTYHRPPRWALLRLTIASFCCAGLSCSSVAAQPAAAPVSATASEIYLLRTPETLIEVKTWGMAGPLVILLPSMGRGAEDFQEVAMRLASQGMRVVAPQPRGVGGSIGALEHLSLSLLAVDVASVLTHENRGPAVIVAHAFGGFVGRQLGVMHPDMVKAFVIVGAGSKSYPRSLLIGSINLSDPNFPADQRDEILRHQMFAPGRPVDVWRSGWYRAAHLAQHGLTTGSWAPPPYPPSVPILDLQGEFDAYRPATSRDELRDALGPQVSVRVVKGAGHVLFQEEPAQVADAISAWIKSNKL